MDLQIAGDVAVVVGGAKGIGLAIGAAFYDEGSHVVLVDIDGAVERAANELATKAGASTTGLTADVADFESMRRIAERVVAARGRVDHVVYAAGCGSGKYGFPFWNLQPADWRRVIDVNLLGAVHATHAFAPVLTQHRRGTLLFLSSIAGQIGSQTDPPYSAAKAAIINFAQCAAKDLARYDVRVNTICPGMVKTTLNQAVWQAWRDQQSDDAKMSYDDWAGEKVRRVAPLGRWQQPEDIAALAVFLASPRAANITGQTLNVDGGQVMHG